MRMLATAFYLGLAPVLRPFGCRRDDPFVQHHAAQALAIILLLVAILSSGFLCWLLLTYAILHQRGLYESLPSIEGWAGPERDALPLAVVLLAWLVVWASGLVLAISGSTRSLPLL